MGFRQTLGRTMQDGVKTFFDLKDNRLQREQRQAQEARAAESHELNKRLLEMQLEDRPKDLAWQDAQRISEALGIDAWDNPGYIGALGKAGVPIQQETPGKYLMAAPDMADGSQGIGPDDVTPNTGVVLPWKARYQQAMDKQKLDEMAVWNAIRSGQIKLDPSNPNHRIILSKMSGVSANEAFGPVRQTPEELEAEAFSRRKGANRADKAYPRPQRTSALEKGITDIQVLTQLNAIKDDAYREVEKVMPPNPRDLDVFERARQGLKEKAAMDAAVKQWIQERNDFVDDYVEREMTNRGLMPRLPKATAPAAPVDFATQGRVKPEAAPGRFIGGPVKQ